MLSNVSSICFCRLGAVVRGGFVVKLFRMANSAASDAVVALQIALIHWRPKKTYVVFCRSVHDRFDLWSYYLGLGGCVFRCCLHHSASYKSLLFAWYADHTDLEEVFSGCSSVAAV